MPRLLHHLPVEILYEIIGYLDEPPPSQSRLRSQPLQDITESARTPLKSLASVNRNLRQVTKRSLLKHARLRLSDPEDSKRARKVSPFLRFVDSHNLSSSIQSLTLVVERNEAEDRRRAAGEFSTFLFDWRTLLSTISPSRVTILASPFILSSVVLGQAVCEQAYWLDDFHIPYQILSVACHEQRAPNASRVSQLDHRKEKNELTSRASTYSLIEIKNWQSLLINEGSYLRGYVRNVYQRLERLPSIIGRLVTLYESADATLNTSHSLCELDYIAAWAPIVVCEGVLKLAHHTRRLALQIVPIEDLAPDFRLRGNIEAWRFIDCMIMWTGGVLEEAGSSLPHVYEIDLRDAQIQREFKNAPETLALRCPGWRLGKRSGLAIRKPRAGDEHNCAFYPSES